MIFTYLIIFVLIFSAAGCVGPAAKNADFPINRAGQDVSSDGGAVAATPTPAILRTGPKSVREFFMTLSEKYFIAESCDKTKDKDCQQAKRDYLKTFLEVEDTKNGYLKAGGDGGQSNIEMAIFRKPDDTYLVAVSTEIEDFRDQYFLEYINGEWINVGDKAVPEFGKDKIYEIPRHGTTMAVFESKVIEKGNDFEVTAKGGKLYDLVWKGGKFSKTQP